MFKSFKIYFGILLYKTEHRKNMYDNVSVYMYGPLIVIIYRMFTKSSMMQIRILTRSKYITFSRINLIIQACGLRALTNDIARKI